MTDFEKTYVGKNEYCTNCARRVPVAVGAGKCMCRYCGKPITNVPTFHGELKDTAFQSQRAHDLMDYNTPAGERLPRIAKKTMPDNSQDNNPF